MVNFSVKDFELFGKVTDCQYAIDEGAGVEVFVIEFFQYFTICRQVTFAFLGDPDLRKFH